jgi:hypothetical protein
VLIAINAFHSGPSWIVNVGDHPFAELTVFQFNEP